MSEHALVIAGDYRTFEYGAHTLEPLTRDRHVYVSTWRTSESPDRITGGTVRYPMSEDTLYKLVPSCKSVEVLFEEYDPTYWSTQHYNSAFIWRQRQAVSMIRRSPYTYDTVTFIRPDIWINDAGDYVSAIADIKPREYVTIWSDTAAVTDRKRLNDISFAVRGEDIEDAVTTLPFYHAHCPIDWHTYLRWFIVEERKFTVRNAHIQLGILRPPVHRGIGWMDVLANTDAWDTAVILEQVKMYGLKVAIGNWTAPRVMQALRSKGKGHLV